jgi:hypothetical protein
MHISAWGVTVAISGVLGARSLALGVIGNHLSLLEGVVE